jgi:hypothetical protein
MFGLCVVSHTDSKCLLRDTASFKPLHEPFCVDWQYIQWNMLLLLPAYWHLLHDTIRTLVVAMVLPILLQLGSMSSNNYPKSANQANPHPCACRQMLAALKCLATSASPPQAASIELLTSSQSTSPPHASGIRQKMQQHMCCILSAPIHCMHSLFSLLVMKDGRT